MPSVTLEEAQARLPELIADLLPGDELRILHEGRLIAVLVPPKRNSWPCQPGSAKDKSHWMAENFDATPEDFKEYM
jgi:antitoxin (DNA-binding transcriptional repressor) of toxin-antitoxin stability system